MPPGVLLDAGGRVAWRTGDLFVVTQVALTMVLLAAASLLTDTFVRLVNVETGFVPEKLVAAQLTLPRRRYASPETILAFANRTLERLRAQPQVAAAAVSTGMPLKSGVVGSVKVEGQPAGEDEPWAVITAVTDDYFRVLQVPLKRGRMLRFEESGDRGAILVDEALVRRFFPNDDPLGKRLTFHGATTATIVGVVGDTRDDLTMAIGPHIYRPLAATPYTFLKVLVRTELEPAHSLRRCERHCGRSIPSCRSTSGRQSGR